MKRYTTAVLCDDIAHAEALLTDDAALTADYVKWQTFYNRIESRQHHTLDTHREYVRAYHAGYIETLKERADRARKIVARYGRRA